MFVNKKQYHFEIVYIFYVKRDCPDNFLTLVFQYRRQIYFCFFLFILFLFERNLFNYVGLSDIE